MEPGAHPRRLGPTTAAFCVARTPVDGASRTLREVAFLQADGPLAISRESWAELERIRLECVEALDQFQRLAAEQLAQELLLGGGRWLGLWAVRLSHAAVEAGEAVKKSSTATSRQSLEARETRRESTQKRRNLGKKEAMKPVSRADVRTGSSVVRSDEVS